jgi:hypothetical protein
MSTPENFISKNLKWFALIFLFLFLVKSVQSCNRGTQIKTTKAEYSHYVDSMKNVEKQYITRIDSLNFELRFEKEKTFSARERADAIQNAVEKVKTNTTITVKGAEQVK